MGYPNIYLVFILYASLCLSFKIDIISCQDDLTLKNYIVHVKQPNENVHDWNEYYTTLLSSFMNKPHERILHSYNNVVTGFSARLNKQEVDSMSSMPWFLHAYQDHTYKLQTTHTPKFLGLQDGSYRSPGLWKASNMGEGMIIGMVDSGVDNQHPSFNDHGMPPPPPKWKGRCDFNNASICNNKMLGARTFIGWLANNKTIFDPPIDEMAHGTMTSGIATGGFVEDAGSNGVYKGVAVGMAPHAHLAVYKVTKYGGVSGNDLIAAIDTAVADGVDVLSLSLGVDDCSFRDFSEDPLAIAAFGAIEKGVFVSVAAGNSGPKPNTTNNDAPWLLTVAASTTDRASIANVELGNGEQLSGQSIYQPPSFNFPVALPLVYGSSCGRKSFTNKDIKGKIVLCDQVGTGESGLDPRVQVKAVQAGSGSGMILISAEETGRNDLTPDYHPFPVSRITFDDGRTIKKYIDESATPVAKIILKGASTGAVRSPIIASFSSRGPSVKSPGILKPDIIGPGVNILVPVPTYMKEGLTFPNETVRPFYIDSGTSLACPHLSGVAAIIKKDHPDWSPAAIKSAIMTTAYVTDNEGKPIADYKLVQADYFSMGAGHVDPLRASDPGLVYDISSQDYTPYLCGLYNKDSAKVSAIVRHPIDCGVVKSIVEGDLNLPSLVAILPSQNPTNVVQYSRTVTNVGKANSRYNVEPSTHDGVSITVEPNTLQFKAENEKKMFKVSIKSTKPITAPVHGYLRWVSKEHVVRSPVVITSK